MAARKAALTLWHNEFKAHGEQQEEEEEERHISLGPKSFFHLFHFLVLLCLLPFACFYSSPICCPFLFVLPLHSILPPGDAALQTPPPEVDFVFMQAEEAGERGDPH